MTSEFVLFSSNSSLNHLKNRKMSPTVHHKYKYLHSTVQRAKDTRQKFHFCRLPFEVLERLSMTFTANGKNETSAVCLQLSVR